MKTLNGDLVVEGTIQANAAPSVWSDPDDAPELTDEWFEKAWVRKNGKPIDSGESHD